jgi:hypothetical protein
MTKHHIGEQLVNSLPLFTSGEPFTIDQIDAHPDAQRIWRTIQEVVNYQWEEYDNLGYIYTQKDMIEAERGSYDQGYKDGHDDCDESWRLEQRESL